MVDALGMLIREEEKGDIGQVRRLNTLAFEGEAEADLVDALRDARAVTLSLVAVEQARAVGHILFSPVAISSGSESFEALGLGPMSVSPAQQCKGVGSSLVRASLERLRAAGHGVVVVLGHPTYYPRFGFRRASEFNVGCEYDVPDAAFMLLELSPGALGGRVGTVKYRPEFDHV